MSSEDSDGSSDWSSQRRLAIEVHTAAIERRRVEQSGQARRLIADFVSAAEARNLPTEPLTALAYHGRTRYRTNMSGWYLLADRSVAIGSDGAFYPLTVPSSFKARISGVTIESHDPPLIVGESGRDGESMPLETLLRRRLEQPGRWP